MKILVHEVLEQVKNCNTDQERIDVLKKYRNEYDVRMVLRATYHPKIVFAVDSVPLYKPNLAPAGLAGNLIQNEIKRLYLFEPTNPQRPKKLTPQKQEKILIQILESLEAKEATVFMNMLLKDQRIPGLTKEVVEKAIPGLFDN